MAVRVLGDDRREEVGGVGGDLLDAVWQVVFTRQAQKDARKCAAAGLRPKAEALLDRLRQNPFQRPPPDEKLVGDLAGADSRRINIQRRLVYQILEPERVVKILRLGTHYE